jgi:hypothetical protein
MTDRGDDPLHTQVEEFWLERTLGVSKTFLLIAGTIVVAVIALLIVLA